MATRLEISSFLDMCVSPRDTVDPRCWLLTEGNKPTQSGRTGTKEAARFGPGRDPSQAA